MRLGVFGGTFDPVHQGHLILAEQCREQGKLDKVLFVPAARPPHKREQPLTSFDHRVEMLKLAVAGHAAFSVDELERDRPGPSYTVETLSELARSQPDAELVLLIGSDTLHDLPQWYSPARIAELASFLVVERPGSVLKDVDSISRELNLPEGVVFRCQMMQMPLIDISSRDLRRRIAQGYSVRYMVPRAVQVYIAEKGLYRT